MRCLYFACISLYLVLFLGNHSHARIRESYEESVARYTAAGFTEERTTVRVPPDDKDCDWHATRKSQVIEGYKEVTWTNKNPDVGGGIALVSIRQLFYGRWRSYLAERKWRQALHCHEITYQFKDSFDDPGRTPEIKLWVEQLVKKSLERFKPHNNWDHHRVQWSGHPGKLETFIIDPKKNEFMCETCSVGKFHTGGKCLTIRLGQNHWGAKFGSVSSKLLEPPLLVFCDSCWRSDRHMKEAQKQKQLAERNRQRQKEVQSMKEAVAKEIKDSGL